MINNLKNYSSQIDFLRIKNNKDKLIFNTKNEDQQKLMIEKLKSNSKIKSEVPRI